MKSKHKKNKIGGAMFRLLQILIMLVLIVFIFVILRGIYFRIQDERSINEGVEALQLEVKKFDQENKDLNKLVKYFDSIEFQEKEIKDKLNLVKDGEKVVFIQGSRSDQENTELRNGKNDSIITTTHANYYYWWKYFFGDKG